MAYYSNGFPRLFRCGETPVIAYVIESWLAEELDSVESFIGTTLERNNVIPEDCLYSIAFAWRLGNKRMLDLWIFTKNHVHEPSGPLVSILLFSEFEPDKATEIASGNTILVLGIEEQHRRESRDLAAYFETRPALPDDILMGKMGKMGHP